MAVILFVMLYPVLHLLGFLAQVYQQVMAQAGPVVVPWSFTPDGTVALVAFVTSLFFKYFPWVRVKYAGLSTDLKSLIMGSLVVIFTVGIVLLHCNQIIQVGGVVCSNQGFVDIALQILWAGSVNQGTYSIFPDTKDVKAAKAARVAKP